MIGICRCRDKLRGRMTWLAALARSGLRSHNWVATIRAQPPEALPQRALRSGGKGGHTPGSETASFATPCALLLGRGVLRP